MLGLIVAIVAFFVFWLLFTLIGVLFKTLWFALKALVFGFVALMVNFPFIGWLSFSFALTLTWGLAI